MHVPGSQQEEVVCGLSRLERLTLRALVLLSNGGVAPLQQEIAQMLSVHPSRISRCLTRLSDPDRLPVLVVCDHRARCARYRPTQHARSLDLQQFEI